MATLAFTLPSERIARIAELLGGVADAYGQQTITVTLDNTAVTITGPDGVARQA